MQDDLHDVLEKIIRCDMLLLGTPIYLANITGEMRSFLERLLFSNTTYNVGYRSYLSREAFIGVYLYDECYRG